MADGAAMGETGGQAGSTQAGRLRIDVGLVNNMPDSAVLATERQFLDLLRAAAGEALDVRLSLFTLPEITRSDRLREAMDQRYQSADLLPHAGLDALIVTGGEPKTADLADEVYWPSFTRLVDWARQGTLSTIWSCLAAQGAVLHMDGVRRHRLAEKCSGIFPWTQTASIAAIKTGFQAGDTPHSRLNDLREPDLEAAGYQIIRRSPSVGVELFIKHAPSLFLMLQGHPEYDAQSLQLEYTRDLGRFARAERAAPPMPPQDYFDLLTEAALITMDHRTAADVAARSILDNRWRAAAVDLYRGWLLGVAQMKAERPARPPIF